MISFIIACVSFSELENDTLNQAELNEIKINTIKEVLILVTNVLDQIVLKV
jgi:hypothetical protein